MTDSGVLLNEPFVVALNTSAPVFLIGQVRETNPQVIVYRATEGVVDKDDIQDDDKLSDTGLKFYRLCPVALPRGKVHSEHVRELYRERLEEFQMWQI